MHNAQALLIEVGKAGLAAPPPSEPDWQISRIRLSGWQFNFALYRDWHAARWACLRLNSPMAVK
jgi:hypothetical protein